MMERSYRSLEPFHRRKRLLWLVGLWMLLAAVATTASESSSNKDELYRQKLRSAVQATNAGEFDRALTDFSEAMALAEQAERLDWQGAVCRERGISFLHQSLWAEARQSFNCSIERYEAAGDPVGATKAWLRLSSMASGGRRFEEAHEILDRVFVTLEVQGDEKDLTLARMHRARAWTIEARYDEALPMLESVEAFYQSVDDSNRLADVYNLKAWTLQQLERWSDAREAYQSLIALAFDAGNQIQVTYAYCNLGDVEQAMGLRQAAEESLDRAIAGLDSLRRGVAGGAQDRLRFLDPQISAYHAKIVLQVDRREPVKALRTADRFHAKTLLEELTQPEPASEGRPLSKQEQTLLDSILTLQRQLIEQGLDPSESAQLRAAEQEWVQLRSAARRAKSREEQGAQPASDSTEPFTLPPQAIQQRLPARTAALSYWVHPDRIMIWIVRSDGIHLVQAPISEAQLNAGLNRFLQPLRDRTRADDLAVEGAELSHLESGRELHRWLIEPALGLLKEIDHLIVVPDGNLWLLPFDALVAQTPDLTDLAADAPLFRIYDKARYVIDDFSVLYAPSLAVWAELAARGSAGDGLLGIAPGLAGSAVARQRGWALGDLPEARREVEAITALSDAAQRRLGSEATERRVKQQLESFRFLHFAAHGYLHPDQPDLSGIFLWPSSETAEHQPDEDGLFQSYEVATLDLRAELVSLATCNSGLGQLSRAEGLVGLARAFLVAGARNVAVSLWPVDDRAGGALMRRFYALLAEGQPLPQALRQAKLDLRSKVVQETIVVEPEPVQFAHPYFWAPFRLVGGDELGRPSMSGS